MKTLQRGKPPCASHLWLINLHVVNYLEKKKEKEKKLAEDYPKPDVHFGKCMTIPRGCRLTVTVYSVGHECIVLAHIGWPCVFPPQTETMNTLTEICFCCYRFRAQST